MSTRYSIVSRRCIFSNKYFLVNADSLVDGAGELISDYISLNTRCSDSGCIGVHILPVRGRKFYLMRVWRHILERYVWHVPSGFIEGSDSSPVDAARRELAEETGFTCDEDAVVSLGRIYPEPSLLSGHIEMFYARLNSQLGIVETSYEIGSSELIEFSFSDLPSLIREADDFSSTALLLLSRFYLSVYCVDK